MDPAVLKQIVADIADLKKRIAQQDSNSSNTLLLASPQVPTLYVPTFVNGKRINLQIYGSSVAPKIYSGRVISNVASAFFPSGMTLTHVGTGIYKITHNLATTALALMANPDVSGEAYSGWGFVPVDANNIELWFYAMDSSFAFQDRDFMFILTTTPNP